VRREQRRIRGLVEALALAQTQQSAAQSHWHQLTAAADRAGRLVDDAIEQASRAESNLAHALGPGRSAVLGGTRYRCVRTHLGCVIQTESVRPNIPQTERC